MALTRTFLAIELDDATRAFIRARVSELMPALPGVRFVAAATWHITLAFLGNIPAEQLAAARAAAQAAATTAGPFTLQTAHIGTFGPDEAPRVIWLGVGGMTRELFALQHQVVTALQAHKVPFNEQHYVPHITLAKPHDPLTPAAAQALAAHKASERDGPVMPVTAISVMKSELTSVGAHYTALERAMIAPQR